MKKSIFTLMLALFMLIFTFVPSFAVSEDPRLVDAADVLTDSEEQTLITKLDTISEKQEFDVIIHVIPDVGAFSMEKYAEEMYDVSGYGYGDDYNGIILVLSMEERDWYMLPNGAFAEEAFTDPCIEYISEQFLPELGEDDYVNGFEIYADLCEDFVVQAKTGEPYGEGNLPKEPYNFLLNIAVAIVLGFVVAFIVTSVMKGKLKSVHSKAQANDYLKKDSLKVTESRDYFLYRQVVRTAKPKSSSSGSSSTYKGSGKGGGGKF